MAVLLVQLEPAIKESILRRDMSLNVPSNVLSLEWLLSDGGQKDIILYQEELGV